jgi:hypothetical protein
LFEALGYFKDQLSGAFILAKETDIYIQINNKYKIINQQIYVSREKGLGEKVHGKAI